MSRINIKMREVSSPITIEYNDGGSVRTIFTLPPTRAPEKPSVYAFSLPKAGSVLLDSILSELASEEGLCFVSLMGEFFEIGLADKNVPAETSKVFLDHGYCFGGFRSFPQRFEVPNLQSCRAILLVRDPRDMIVSHYYSTRSSHPDPGRTLSTSLKSMPLRDQAQKLAIDEYALQRTRFYGRLLSSYIDVLAANPNTFRVYRYEDVIFNKQDWIADICTHFNWSVSRSMIRKIADRNDIRPRVEKESKHVRQVSPGDHRRKLRAETIDQLNVLLDRELRYFGYHPASTYEQPR
jgi:sulfotransferase family protein